MASSSKTKWPLATKKEREYIKAKLTRDEDPEKAVREYQAERSLHTMMAKAFGTTPKYLANTPAARPNQVVESLDTDSILEFLSHFGATRLDMHKRVGDALRTQLEEEIRKVQGTAPLLKLLSNIWFTATKVPELRPVVWAILKRLGTDTPKQVLEELSKQQEPAYAEMWKPLSPLLKRLVWECDWDSRVGDKDPDDPNEYYLLMESTMFAQRVQPIVNGYCHEKLLVESANRPFVTSLRERRMVTSHRRALLKGEAAANAPTVAKAVSELRQLLAGDTPAFRPKLLNAFLSILMARHGLVEDTELVGGAAYLYCTLVADILLSGPLPKAYQPLLTLARTLDEVVKAGALSNSQLSQIQGCLRQIYPTDEADMETQQSKSAAVAAKTNIDRFKRETLNKIITSGLEAMKEADPQSLFLNPVTDAIAPGYSRVIKQPMCIKTMESKINSYETLQEWETDVKLVFRNCINYNTGNAGQWFRGEARRQMKVFMDDIYPQALKFYQSAIGTRSIGLPKRKREGSSEAASIEPLPGIKGKMQKKEVTHPSLPAVASMLLADPFVVRILLDRALRCLRIDVNRGATLPAAHHVLPSVLQLLHLASWSTRLCAIRGKLYALPDVGMIPPTEEDIISLTPFATLRRFSPILMRLLVESEVDRRMATGGDLHLVAQSREEQGNPSNDEGQDLSHLDVLRSLTEGALVHICQPGNTHESSLAITLPKFYKALMHLSTNLWNQRPFFISLIQALLRHKSKLSRASRDIVAAAWLEWLGPDKTKNTKEGSMTSPAHECFIMLLNEWAALGNILLPRDAMLSFASDAVRAANSSESDNDRKFPSMWNKPEFSMVQKQYDRMLQHLPEFQTMQWKEEVAILENKDVEDEDAVMAEAPETEKLPADADDDVDTVSN